MKYQSILLCLSLLTFMQPGIANHNNFLSSVPYVHSILHYDNRCAEYEEGGNTCPVLISHFPYECETHGPPDPSGNRNRIAGREGFPLKTTDVIESDEEIVDSGPRRHSH